jgi:uncharacterized protein involved in exopolysaccharide biosynthesis
MRAEPTIELPPRLGAGRLRPVDTAPRPAPAAEAAAAKAPAESRPARRIGFGLLALLVLPALVCAAAAFAGAMALDKVHAARADILFHLTRSGDLAERFLATQAVVARSNVVLQPVAAELGVPVDRIDEELSIDFPKGGAVMRIEFASPSATAALDVVKLVTQRYLAALRPIEAAEGATHQVLAAPFLLDEPVWPKPVQATVLGGLLGLAISAAMMALRQRPRR